MGALSNHARDHLKYGVASSRAADEIENLLGGYAAGGDTIWVDSGANGSNAVNDGSYEKPYLTLDFAIGKCTASNGDAIVIKPGHAETTTAIALDVAGVKIVGLGYGRNRPTFTSTAAATDLIDVTAANCQLCNVRLVGAASACVSLIDGTSAATDFELHNCELVSAATPVELITWSGARLIVEDLTVTQSADGLNYIVVFEAGVDDFRFSRWNVHCPLGIDNGLIYSGGFAHIGYIIEDITAVGVDGLIVNFISSTAAPPDGFFVSGNIMYSAAQTSVEDGVATATAKGMAFGRVYATDAIAKSSGLIPITTAS